ncbi:MAG TPA: hypothetical protein VK002_12825 [Rubricoccaceae bacterium]|nr:hypothetical protein [Rubricoccaceae bacterium]
MIRSFSILALAVGLGALLAACDAASTGTDADVLLTDARLARQAGDLDEAVALLEEAYALDPALTAVRVELSATYLQREGIDLLDVDRLMRHVTGSSVAPHPLANAAGSAAEGRAGATCVYEDDPTATPFALSDVEGYADLFGNQDVVDDALALLHDAPDGDLPVMPEALRAVALCGAVVDGRLVYDREAALAALRADGLTDDEIAAALAVNGATLFLDSYFFLAEDLPQQTAWYRLADGTIGVCAEDPDALRTQTEAALADFFEALASLDLRAELIGGGPAREIVDHGVAAYEALRGHFGPVCGA